MHIVVIEDDEGLRGILRSWMEETGSIITGDANPKTYDGIDILIVGPNATQVNMAIVEKKLIPFMRIGFSPNMDAVMRWVLDMQKDILNRADQCIAEDRAV